jgi:4'-phosphopantetheinyl transferase
MRQPPDDDASRMTPIAGALACSVRVWTIALPGTPEALAPFRPILGDEERDRAARFHRAEDRDRYVTAHGALRLILADCVAADPAGLRFTLARHGKPALVREAGWPDLRFNLSHSGDLAVVAVAVGREVGIDVERIDPRRADMDIARRFFSPREVAALRGLAEADRARGFFACWTRKEAYIKGRGEGLSLPLDGFDVSLTPGEPAALLCSRIDPDDIGRWSLHEVTVGEGYAAALAVESAGAPVAVACRAFAPAPGA